MKTRVYTITWKGQNATHVEHCGVMGEDCFFMNKWGNMTLASREGMANFLWGIRKDIRERDDLFMERKVTA